jgi:hypothetical protein
MRLPLIPLILASFGRSGSSLLLSILNKYKEIFIPGPFPYERRYLSYLAKLSKSIYLNADNRNNNLSYLDTETVCFTGNPFIYEDSLLRSGCTREILSKDLFILSAISLLINLHKESSSSIFWAEKGIDQIESMNTLGINEWNCIRLIRDPRDLILSHIQFHNIELSDPGIQFFLNGYKNFLLSIMNSNDEDLRMFDCKYEDMLFDGLAFENKICKFLNIEYKVDQIDFSNLNKNHKTSIDFSASVGRYKNLVDQPTLSLIHKVDKLFEEQLEYFKWV